MCTRIVGVAPSTSPFPSQVGPITTTPRPPRPAEAKQKPKPKPQPAKPSPPPPPPPPTTNTTTAASPEMNRMTAPHGGMPPPPMPAAGGLARYGSAPGSLLASIADSVIRGGGVDQLHHQHQLLPPPPPPQTQQQQQMVGRYFSAESSGLTSCESSCRTTTTTSTAAADVGRHPLERAYGGSGEIHVDASSAAAGVPLFRHSSSPAGLLSRLMADPHGNGMAATRGMGGYSGGGGDAGAMAHRRLSSQWSFSRQDLPQISEMGGLIPDIGESIVTGGCNSSSDGTGHGAQSSSFLSSRNFSMSSWDDTNSIMFSPPSSSKKARVAAAAAAGNHGDDMVSSFSNIDSQQSSLEMAGMDDFLQLQPDSVACRARAKRGCATHPRSIAERERRTRISKRLKKLQDLVPNMDKQTNTSDMLDIAVTYIKELQGQVEKLKHDQANCTCSGKHDC
uniref:BHLH domain-containing protein n=1 Tax=Oryza meridionalis TaxID=40149 RepID=A0A0E0CBN1_9ORYZ